MPRRKGQDYLFQLLVLINGRPHPRTGKLFDSQKELIQFLKENPNKIATRQEVQKFLKLEFEKHPKNSKEHNRLSGKFYTIVSPLLDWIIESNGTEYELSYDLFQKNLSSLRRAGENYFK